MDMWDVSNVIGDRRLICEQAGEALRFRRVIPVHGSNGTFTHVTWDDQNTLANDEDKFAEVLIIEPCAKFSEFLFGQYSSFGNLFESLSDLTTRIGVEEPKACHGGVVDDGIILFHGERKSIDTRFQIEKRIAVGHSMIAEDMETDLAVMTGGGLHDAIDPIFVCGEFLADFG